LGDQNGLRGGSIIVWELILGLESNWMSEEDFNFLPSEFTSNSISDSFDSTLSVSLLGFAASISFSDSDIFTLSSDCKSAVSVSFLSAATVSDSLFSSGLESSLILESPFSTSDPISLSLIIYCVSIRIWF